MTEDDLEAVENAHLGTDLEVSCHAVAKYVQTLRSRISGIIDGYEWACDYDCADYSPTAQVIIEQLRELLEESKDNANSK